MRPPALHRTLLVALVLIGPTFAMPSPADAGVLELIDRESDSDLRYPSEVAISPDGLHLYLGSLDQTTHFSRDPVSGELTYVSVGPGDRSIAMSADGRAYFASSHLGLDARRRDVESGAMALVESWEGPPVLDRLYPEKVWLSPDDRHLYVGTDDALVVFAVDPSSHALTWTQSIFDGFDGIDGLAPSQGLAFSPGGDTVYVTGFELDGIGSFSNGALLVFARDPSTGELALRQTLDGDDGFADVGFAKDVWASDDGRHVYAIGVGGLVVFERDSASGSLSFVQAAEAGASLFSGTAFAASPDGRFLYAFHFDDFEIFARHVDSGRVERVHEADLDIESVFRAESVRISSDGRFLYLATSNNSPYGGSLSVYSRDLATGQLERRTTLYDDPEGDAEVGEAQAVAVSPDGRNVYVGGRRSTFSVAAFSRSDGGHLEVAGDFLGWTTSGSVATATSLALDPDGRNLYAAVLDLDGHSLATFARDASTGELVFLERHIDEVGGVDGLGAPTAVVVSPDGQHVYVAGNVKESLAVFERDPSSGGLTFQRAYFNGQDGIDGLERPDSLAFSPEGDHLYAASRFLRPMSIFARDAATGELNFVEAQSRNSYFRPVVSPDGGHVYAGTDALHTFARDPATGRLTLVERRNSSPGAPVVSPDGRYVFRLSSLASVFRRDPATGLLTLVETTDLPGDFGGAGAVAQSADGASVYAASSNLNLSELLTFRVNEGPCRADWDGLCLLDRFQVSVDWRDFEGNRGTATPRFDGTDESGLLWFFGPANWEMQIKMLDGCSINDRFWVFAAATTNVEYTLRVTDSVTGTTREYFNPLGRAADAITDTDAFASCDGVTDSGSKATRTNVASKSALRSLGGGSGVSAAVPEGRTVAWDPEAIPKSYGDALVTGLDGKCLDVEGGVVEDGAPVILYDCHRKSNQRWRQVEFCAYKCFEEFHLEVFEDHCLVPGAETQGDFRPLVIEPCVYGENLWLARGGHFPQQFSLYHLDTGLCADALGASSQNHTPVGLFPCTGNANQAWTYDEIRCDESPTALCKTNHRFRIEVSWRDFDGNEGVGRVVPTGSVDSGLFWFFGPDNYEMLVKVLDGCDLNDQFWVFAAATTNVEYTLRVTDMETGEVREYVNPLGNAAPAITDTAAFTCVP